MARDVSVVASDFQSMPKSPQFARVKRAFTSPGKQRTPTAFLPPAPQPPLAKKAEDSDEDSEESDSSSESDGGNDTRDIIDVRRAWGTMMGASKYSSDVHAALLEHRELEMERRLSIPDEHPRSNSSEDIAGDEHEGERGRRSDSIEIRRTDAPQYAVRAEQRWDTAPRTGTFGHPPYPMSRRLYASESQIISPATASRLR